MVGGEPALLGGTALLQGGAVLSTSGFYQVASGVREVHIRVIVPVEEIRVTNRLLVAAPSP